LGAELSEEAFQARKAKAQQILSFFTAPTAPTMTPELEELKTKAQQVVNAFATLNRKNASANNKKTANTTIRKSNMLNRARTLKVPSNANAPKRPSAANSSAAAALPRSVGRRTRKRRQTRSIR
jgi:hypothetical protein